MAKLKVKLREYARGIPGYQFLAGCNLFRHEVPNRTGDRLSVAEFLRVVEYKFGMKLDPDEVSSLFHFLVPGTGESIEIAQMVRLCSNGSRTRLPRRSCQEGQFCSLSSSHPGLWRLQLI